MTVEEAVNNLKSVFSEMTSEQIRTTLYNEFISELPLAEKCVLLDFISRSISDVLPPEDKQEAPLTITISEMRNKAGEYAWSVEYNSQGFIGISRASFVKTISDLNSIDTITCTETFKSFENGATIQSFHYELKTEEEVKNGSF